MQNSFVQHRSVLTSSGLGQDILPPEVTNYTVYGEDYCGFTSAARNLLKATNKDFKYRTFGNRQTRNSFAQKYAFNHGTIPMVFYNGQFIGGFEQLKNHLANK